MVPKPGFTDFAIFIYDQNGLLDYVCQKLNEKQVEYINLQTWGYVNPGFKGSAIISATFWEHDVFDPNAGEEPEPAPQQVYDVPELMYYKFDGAGSTTVANEASSPVGTNPAPVLGLTIGGTGQFGEALVGVGGSSSTNRVDTGWATGLSGSWTISLWLDDIDPTSTSLRYVFGDSTATSFRAFLGGVAGAGNIILRGPVADTTIAGVGPGPSVATWVYDSTVPEIRGYLERPVGHNRGPGRPQHQRHGPVHDWWLLHVDWSRRG